MVIVHRYLIAFTDNLSVNHKMCLSQLGQKSIEKALVKYWRRPSIDSPSDDFGSPLPKDSRLLRNGYPTKALRDLQSCRQGRFMQAGRQASKQESKQASKSVHVPRIDPFDSKWALRALYGRFLHTYLPTLRTPNTHVSAVEKRRANLFQCLLPEKSLLPIVSG